MSKSNDALRRQWIAHWRGWYEAVEAGRTDYPSIPEELHDLRCGAKTRAGTPCKMKSLYCSGRCKLHGGLSTGPKSDAGKAQARENGKLGGRGRRAKPKPMYDLTKHHACSEVESVLAAELGSLEKPNPVMTVRSQQVADAENVQGRTQRDAGLVRWRAYCAERGIQLHKPAEPPPPLNTNRVHIIPAPRSVKR